MAETKHNAISVMAHLPSIMFLGLRGFPNIQGGVETHMQHLAPMLVKLGCRVEIVVRAPYMRQMKDDSWSGVTYRRIWSPRSKGLEAIVHTFLGVLYAAMRRPDVLHIQAIGPALMTPLARLFGLRVVVTHHGPDYERQKWGSFAKWILRTGERFGMRFSNQRIVISGVIRGIVQKKYDIDSALIPNGVALPEIPASTAALGQFGLTPGKYVLLVSRLVPEKRHHDLIEAFSRAGLADWKLALVGASDHPDAYMQSVLDAVRTTPNSVATGFQTSLALRELYAHAGMFVLPSSHEGLPIALLEALSYGLPVIASDIPANLEVGLGQQHYFALGDTAMLAQRISDFTKTPYTSDRREAVRKWVGEKYNWHDIASKTLEVYRAAVMR